MKPKPTIQRERLNMLPGDEEVLLREVRKLKDRQLLVSRVEAAVILNTSKSSIVRIEREGRLSPILLRPGITSKTFYRKSEVEALANSDNQIVRNTTPVKSKSVKPALVV